MTVLGYLGPVHTGTQSFRSIFVPVSGTRKETVHTGTERLRIGFLFLFTQERNRSVPQFSL